MQVVSEVSEAFYAAIARGLITLLLAFPGMKTWWESTQWKQVVIAGICLVSAVGVWAIECPLEWADIPGYAPRCGSEGFILDVLYAAFLAWILNWAGENAFRWARDRKGASSVSGTALVLFLVTVAVEAVLLVLGLPWATSLAISVLVAILAGILGALAPAVARLGISPHLREILWWLMLAAKIVIHLLPIPFFLKPILSVALTLILFVLVNFG